MIDIKGVRKLVEDIAKKAVENQNGLDLYQISNINLDYTYNIKKLNSSENYEHVSFLGFNLGNGKGLISQLEVNDLVLVGFLKDSELPFILGSVFNRYMSSEDQIIPILPGELFLNATINGSYIFINDKEDVVINTNTGSKIKLKKDGSFKLFNKTNHGVEVDSSGNMTFRGVTINHTQTPGDFNG